MQYEGSIGIIDQHSGNYFLVYDKIWSHWWHKDDLVNVIMKFNDRIDEQYPKDKIYNINPVTYMSVINSGPTA